MSVDTPPEPDRSEKTEAPVLRREALLPNERSRGLGTVAVVCTMAGVASGLALATTLMAMQVADSMTVRSCPYRVAADVQEVEVHPDQGFLGAHLERGKAQVHDVVAGSPADAIRLRPGDYVISVDGAAVRNDDELVERIKGLTPGTQPTLIIDRDGTQFEAHPTLAPRPLLTY